MTQHPVEDSLVELGSNWPVPSVTKVVMARLESEASTPRQSPGARHWRLGLYAAGATAFIALLVLSVVGVSTPRTLQAQVEKALAQTSAAHIVISNLDLQGTRYENNIWYSHRRGYRSEVRSQIVFDDGKHQWSWNPLASSDHPIVERRRSTGGMEWLSEMFALKNMPADWKRERASEYDSQIAGQRCLAYAVFPFQNLVPAHDGVASPLVADPSPRRIIVWTDPQERIIQIQQQRQHGGKWQSGAQASIHYDVEAPAEKFVLNLPAGANIVDVDLLLEQQFPLQKALATVESEGLLFAVHEAERLEDGMFFLVTSVRGTPRYLRDHPPKPRWQTPTTAFLDVAKWDLGSVDREVHRATLADAQSQDGVDYLWWIAAPRKYFSLKDGVRTEETLVGPSAPSAWLEATPGKLRVPLEVYAWPWKNGKVDRLVNVKTKIEVSLPTSSKKTLAEIATRVRRDALLLAHAEILTYVHGRVKNDAQAYHEPDQITDSDYAEEVKQQLGWLQQFDEL